MSKRDYRISAYYYGEDGRRLITSFVKGVDIWQANEFAKVCLIEEYGDEAENMFVYAVEEV